MLVKMSCVLLVKAGQNHKTGVDSFSKGEETLCCADGSRDGRALPGPRAARPGAGRGGRGSAFARGAALPSTPALRAIVVRLLAAMGESAGPGSRSDDPDPGASGAGVRVDEEASQSSNGARTGLLSVDWAARTFKQAMLISSRCWRCGRRACVHLAWLQGLSCARAPGGPRQLRPKVQQLDAGAEPDKRLAPHFCSWLMPSTSFVTVQMH